MKTFVIMLLIMVLVVPCMAEDVTIEPTMPLETNITQWLSAPDVNWQDTNITQLYPENATVITRYTGSVRSYSTVEGLDLVFECLVAMVVFSFVSMVFLGLLVWKMYFGSGGAK